MIRWLRRQLSRFWTYHELGEPIVIATNVRPTLRAGLHLVNTERTLRCCRWCGATEVVASQQPYCYQRWLEQP